MTADWEGAAKRLRESVKASTDPHWKAKHEQRARQMAFCPAQPLSSTAARLLLASGAVREES